MQESTYAKQVREYYEKMLGSLKGLTLVGAGAVEDDDGIWPVLYFRDVRGKNPKTHVVIAMRDPEGNGPGAFELGEAEGEAE